MMSKSYSIAEARDNFAAIVREIEERVSAIELTRRGKPVAVLLSVGEYRRLSGQAGSATARRRSEVFEGLRDVSPGRETRWQG
jgi:antitoxin Phd